MNNFTKLRELLDTGRTTRVRFLGELPRHHEPGFQRRASGLATAAGLLAPTRPPAPIQRLSALLKPNNRFLEIRFLGRRLM